MEIPKHIYTSVHQAVKEALKHKDYELEVKHQGRVTRDGFTRALQYYRAQGFKQVDQPETLDIFFMHKGQQYRFSVHGKDSIQQYCLKNKLADAEGMSKKFVQGFRPVVVEDFGFKVDLRNEVKVTDDMLKAELLLSMPSAAKGFRIKKRFSFTDTKHHLRYDLTVVKRSTNVGNDFLAHPRFTLIGAVETYEMEIEMIPPVKDAAKTTEHLLKAGIRLHAVVNGIENVIGKQEKYDVLRSYVALWNKEVPTAEVLMAKPRSFFMGPQPITLELSNIAQDAPLGTTTVLEDYTVTEKADGERCLLYVGKEGRAYIINNKLEVFALGVSVPAVANSLFDGEHITRDAEGRSIRIFAMFDVYFHKGKDTRTLPLIHNDEKSAESRVAIMQSVVTHHHKTFHPLVLHAKEFHHDSESIFKAAKRVLDMVHANVFVYRIDGMILTPKDLPVGALYKQSTPSPQGTWTKLFKWKPVVENTIDMQVKPMNEVSMVNGVLMKVFTLHIGYKPSQWEPIKPKQYLQKGLRPDTRYKVIPFHPSSVLDRDISLFYGDKCKNGDDILPNAIVEFAYIKDEALPYPQRWVPLRVRKDKVMPNDFSTAMNVWRSIEMPVTDDMITGAVEVYAKDLPQEDVYYKRQLSRDKFASRNMMDFHNYWNKSHFMIQKYAKGKTSLFDIACGKGGDLKRWMEAGLTTVFGMDKARDNIENPNDGIYARLAQAVQRGGVPEKAQFMFATMDGAVPVKPATVATLSEDDRFVGEKMLAHGPCDIVSCQFAIHYFFKDEETLDAFVTNVDRFLSPGGYFIGSCLDGMLIKKKLASIELHESVTGKLDERVLWNIRKEYEGSDTEAPPLFGEEIQIYMESIGVEMSEYLVSMSALIQKLAPYNIVPVDMKSFKETHREVLAMDASAHNTYYIDACRNMTEVEKEYSFLNMLFAFRKETKTVKSPVVVPVPVPAPAPAPAPLVDAPPQKKKVVKKQPKAT